MAGHDGPEIRRILEEEYGIIRANGDFVYKRDGWKRAMKDKIQLNSVEK